MNERPTPETDEAQFGTNRVSVNFARRLERERDEAREQLRLANIDCYAALTELDAAREPLGFFDATNAFIDSGLLHYANHSAKDLTQVFMHGPFAGWSERQVIELIRRMDENRKIYRLAMEPSRDTNTEGGPQ